jgi:hypothetical protein
MVVESPQTKTPRPVVNGWVTYEAWEFRNDQN